MLDAMPLEEEDLINLDPQIQRLRQNPAEMRSLSQPMMHDLIGMTAISDSAQHIPKPHSEYISGLSGYYYYTQKFLTVQQRASIIPSSPTPSITSVSSILTPDPLHCALCSASFTGDYRKGNLSRHMRLKHGDDDRKYNCEGCRKVFKRQDARLKHYRKHHPELSSGPPNPRKSFS